MNRSKLPPVALATYDPFLSVPSELADAAYRFHNLCTVHGVEDVEIYGIATRDRVQRLHDEVRHLTYQRDEYERRWHDAREQSHRELAAYRAQLEHLMKHCIEAEQLVARPIVVSRSPDLPRPTWWQLLRMRFERWLGRS